MIRWLKWSPLLLAVIFALSGGSLWAHQVIAERLAHSSFSGADTTLQAEIERALRQGYPSFKVEPYQRSLYRITSTPAPTDKTFWSGTTASFYSHQTADLQALDKQLHAQVITATRHMRFSVSRLLDLYQHAVDVAKSHGLGTKRYVKRLDGRRYQARQASTFGDYQRIVQQLHPHLARFRRMVHARLADMHHSLHAAYSSPRHLQAIRNIIRARAATAWSDLGLLRQFGKYRHLSGRLGHLEAWGFKRDHIKKAAIAAADMGSLAGAIHRKLTKVAPAKWILVSTEDETIRWFQGATQIGYSFATTGNPELPTVIGHFKIFAKLSPFTFRSTEPVDSPLWYPPSPVSYAMEFQSAGYFIHDAPWRSAFGPGTNGYGQPGTNYGGTHGCVNVPYDVAAALFAWAPVGTLVIVV